MKIKSIHIENFRGLVDEYVEFNDSMTVLAGGNGGGKSSLLEAVSIMLSWLPVELSNYTSTPLRIKSSDITFGKKYSRLTMTLTGKRSKDIRLVLSKRARRSSKNSDTDMGEAKKFSSDMRVLLDSPEGANIEIPVFAHYGTNRNYGGNVSPTPSDTTARTSIYEHAFSAGTNFQKFAQWIVATINARENEIAEASQLPLKIANKRRDEINRKYSSILAIKRALADFGDIFKDVEVRDGKLFITSKNIPASNLSDGEKTVGALIADIAMRMAVANPMMNNPLESEAIVLIDELDLHLHPDWQTAIADRLPRIFVNAQFIISSHSPTIMAFSKNLYKIRGDGGEQRLEKVEGAFGRNPADVLSSVLNASREPITAKKIAKMYDFIDRGNYAGAQKIIDELNLLIPDDPDVVRAEYLVRALNS